MKLPKELITVTPLSKLLAAIVFITFPIIGFFIGMKYQTIIDLTNYQQRSLPILTPSPDLNREQNDSTETANWQTYRNDEYGIQFQYPPAYSLTPSADDERCFLATRSEFSCILSFTLAAGDSKYDPPAYFFLVRGVGSVSLAGQTMRINFDAQQKEWVRTSDGLDGVEHEVLEVWAYTNSGHEIIKTFTGGSHASSDDYLIADYANDVVAVFKVPSSRRIRCDLIEEPSEKAECETYYNSVIDTYGGGEELAGGWLPREHLETLYTDAKAMVLSIQFTDSLDTFTWQTYRSEEFGFEVKYPENTALNVPDVVVNEIKSEGYPEVRIGEFQQGCSLNISRASDENGAGGAELDYVASALRKRNNATFFLGMITTSQAADPYDCEVLFNQILSTFRFVE